MPLRRALAPMVAALASAAPSSLLLADQIDAVWAPAADGNWNTAINWSPFGVPDNTPQDFYIVRIDDESDTDVTVFLNTDVTINGLTIDGGDRLRINNARNLTIFGGPIGNAGVLELFSNNDFETRLRIDGDVTLNGTGAVMATGNFRNVITTTLPFSRLTNLTNPITGTLQLGKDVLSFTSHALLEANVSGQPIIVNPPADGDVTNNFMMRASNGGILDLRDGVYENALGTFAALDGSTIVMKSGVEIRGGTLTTEPFGDILVQGDVRAIDVANTGNLTIQNDRRLFVEGSLANSALVDVISTNDFPGKLTLDGDVTLTGGGLLTLTGSNAKAVLDAVTTGDRLTNVDNTIQGEGQLGLDMASLTNHSIVEADRDGIALIVNPPDTGDVTNTGTMRAINGAALILSGGLYDNTGGLIEAQDASLVSIRTDASITGGTVRSTDTGAISVLAQPARFSGVVHDATTTVENSRQLILDTSFDLHGNLTLVSVDVFPTKLTLDGDLTVTGPGTITMTNDLETTNTCTIDALTPGDRLTLGANATIEGSGNVGGDTMSTTNLGRIDANHPSFFMTIDPPASGDFTNLGTLVASGPNSLRIAAGPFENAGVVTIQPGVLLRRIAGDYLQTAGSTRVAGELQVDAGVVDLRGGTLDGAGLVDASIVVDGGTVAPGTSAGTLDVDGDYASSLEGILEIEIGGLVPGAEHDVLAITGSATLDGSLRISLIDGFAPSVGDTFTVLTADEITGVFPCVRFPEVANGAFVVTYETDRVVVSLVPSAPSSADLDGDGTVGFGDLLLLLAEWGPCPSNCCPKDLDGSGAIDWGDLVTLLSNWD